IAGEKREEAWDKGRFAAGVATRAGLFLRGDQLAEMHLLGRAGLFAHELTHVSQRKLAEGGRGGAAQWILEGHADWVKVQALDLLIERYGSAKLLEFLGRFALQTAPREHWRTVFPISYRQFIDEFRARLEALR